MMPELRVERGGEEHDRQWKHFEQRLQRYVNMRSEDIRDGRETCWEDVGEVVKDEIKQRSLQFYPEDNAF